MHYNSIDCLRYFPARISGSLGVYPESVLERDGKSGRDVHPPHVRHGQQERLRRLRRCLRRHPQEVALQDRHYLKLKTIQEINLKYFFE